MCIRDSFATARLHGYHYGSRFRVGIPQEIGCFFDDPGDRISIRHDDDAVASPHGQAPERRALKRALSEPEWDVEPELKARGLRGPSKLNEQRRILRLDDCR